MLPTGDRWCVEFGAWDGMFLTNTRHFIESQDFAAVLIEANPERFADLKRNYVDRDTVHPVNAFVGYGADDNLDAILAKTPIPENFDLLSIDIDGNDYHVWQAVKRYRPKIVVTEFNPTIPPAVRFVQPRDPATTRGASLLSLVELGREKGYELVAVLRWNAVFVKAEYFPLFEIDNNAPEVMRTDLQDVTWIFSGYDGKVFLEGACQLPWHGMRLKPGKFQVLPWFLRKIPASYGLGRRAALKLYRILTRSATPRPRCSLPAVSLSPILLLGRRWSTLK